ncbi:transglutaminase domain-containing protein [Chitinophaga sp.]|uniref:transglutaminase domain-containing protein n=1 Tax=Chitinophaga sp. TaxID=1869181 RepID=UPI0026319A44|nr:transglutaminase domain-containing protein [uncultured Chitinophaga sp.]
MRTALTSLCLSTLLYCLVPRPAHALEHNTVHTVMETAPSNVIIREKKERYEFVRGDKQNPVWVREKINTTYRCNEFRESIPIVTFYNDYSRVEEVKAWVNSDRIKVKPEHRYYSIEDIFYADARICGFMLPFKKKDTESRTEIEKITLDPRYFTSVYFQEDYFTASKEITVVIPRWMKAEVREMNFAGAGIQSAKSYDSRQDADVYTYTAQQLKPFKSESGAPGPSYLYPHLLISSHSANSPAGPATYFGNLQNLYAWYHRLASEVENDRDAVKATAAAIVKGKTTGLDKIKAVYTWMQENIRYIAFEDGIAGFKPAKAQEVLSKKYGDCKGMANLTREMLASLGFDARLCWIGTRHIAYDYSLPTLAVDNHMICAVYLDGKTWFLDATETYIGFDQYAERIQGRQVLIENGDQYHLSRIPERTFEQNLQTEKRTLRIEGAQLAGSVSHRMTGECTESLLSNVHQIRKPKLDEALEQYLSRENGQYRIANMRTSDLHDWNTDLLIHYELTHNDAVSAFGDELYVEMDFRKEMEDAVIDTAKRQHDFWLPYKRQLVQETVLTLPEGFRVKSLPPALHIDQPKYAFKAAYEQQNGKVVYKKEIIIRDTRIQRSDFAAWNTDIKKLRQSYLEQISLTKK